MKTEQTNKNKKKGFLFLNYNHDGHLSSTTDLSNYLSKKAELRMDHLQHVRRDLIQILDVTDIHCQQWPLTLTQQKAMITLGEIIFLNTHYFSD